MRGTSEAGRDQGHGTAGGDSGASTGRRTGRKTNGGTTEVPDFPTIKQATADLMKRFKKLQNAKDDYQDAVAKVAERTNVNARNLNKLIKCSAKGNYVDVRRDVDQLGAIFEMVGEVSGGPSTASEEK